jgi:hypothetical protein
MFPEKIRDHAGILLRQFAGALRKDQKSVGTAFQALHDEIPGTKSLKPQRANPGAAHLHPKGISRPAH